MRVFWEQLDGYFAAGHAGPSGCSGLTVPMSGSAWRRLSVPAQRAKTARCRREAPVERRAQAIKRRSAPSTGDNKEMPRSARPPHLLVLLALGLQKERGGALAPEAVGHTC